ncbi:MAG: nitroreductase family protein [Anaerolineaceae bacterium]|nr:nitroreductase family protein [Anaerolineaceae bacterium]
MASLASQKTLASLWVARAFIGLVMLSNLYAALPFYLFPQRFASAYELSGVPGNTALAGMGLLFLMWQVPFMAALIHPLKNKVSLYELICMQLIGLLGESLLYFRVPAQHALLRQGIQRFIIFDGIGLGFLWLALWLVKKCREMKGLKMDFKELVYRTRSYRRFEQSQAIPRQNLEAWAGLARLVPSSANAQALKFLLINESSLNEKVFQHLSFAGYLKDWGGPKPGEQPSAYILILGDTQIKHQFDMDAGIAAQTIMLAANAEGFGGVIMAAIQRDALRQLLSIPAQLEIVVLLALGKPAEQVVVEQLGPEHGIRYYRDAKGVHHVPKRALQELILWPEDFQTKA